jgi:hypothetical protein
VRRGTAVLAVALAGALGACGGSAPSGTSTGTSTGPSAGTTAGSGTATASATGGAAGTGSPTAGAGSASGCGARLQITVKGSTVTPPPGTTDVRAGCEVDLTITADRTSEVHVHVVDLEKPITAGQPLRISFTPTQQGVYEVELHDPDLLLVKLAVR